MYSAISASFDLRIDNSELIYLDKSWEIHEKGKINFSFRKIPGFFNFKQWNDQEKGKNPILEVKSNVSWEDPDQN